MKKEIINYFFMSEPKILGKIDLSQFSKERRPQFNLEKSFKFLNKELEQIATEFNSFYGDFIEKDGTIKMIGEDEALHKKVVAAKNELYGEKKDLPQMAELAITVFLNKIIGDRFIVVRSAKYDDYEHGVDNVLVDKQTGFVVCGFDQVLGMGSNDGADKKREKVARTNAKGGARLDYGIKLDAEQKIKITKMKNIPAFFLGLSKDDLISLLNNMSQESSSGQNSNKDQDSDLSKNILNKIFKSLKEQEESIKSLLENNKDSEFSSNIKNFSELLSFLESKI